MADLEGRFNTETRLETKIENFCKNALPDKMLKELELQRIPFFIIALLCIIINFASIISNFLFFAKRDEWIFNFDINEIILEVFFATIIIFLVVYNWYSFKIKNQIILTLFQYAGTFKFGNKSQSKTIINELKQYLPKYADLKCSDRYIGKYKNTTIDIIKFTLGRYIFIPHVFGKSFDGFLIKFPYDKQNMVIKKLLARRDDGIDDITVTIKNGNVCIILSTPRKIWFTFSLLFPATNRIVYNNIIKEIHVLLKIINEFVG